MQELAEGKSLSQMVQEGWRGKEQEASRIAKEVLRILRYLGHCRPAVTHRYFLSLPWLQEKLKDSPTRNMSTYTT